MSVCTTCIDEGAEIPASPEALAAAKWFASHGHGIFPVWGASKARGCFCPKGKGCDQKPGKHPANANGFLGATTDPERIEKMLSNPGTPNYGIRPAEGYIVLDKDGDLKDWPEDAPPTLTISTPNGEHVWYQWLPEEVPVNLFGKIVRSHEKGYVVGPGSSTHEGKYLRDPDEPKEIADAPLSWAFVPNKGAPKASAGAVAGSHTPLITVSDTAYVVPDAVPEGLRYEAIRDYVASRYNTGMSRDAVLAAAETELGPALSPPLTHAEFESRFNRTWKGIETRLGPPASVPDAPIDVESVLSASIVPMHEYLAAIPTVVEWVAEPFIYQNSTLLLSGPPKGGKSTLLAGLLTGRFVDKTFLDDGKVAPVRQGPTLVISEEQGISVRVKFGALPNLDIMDRRAHALAKLSFVQLLQVIDGWNRSVGGDGLVLLDTLSVFARLKDENDASEITQAISLVNELAATSDCISVAMTHHTRKSGGEHGEGIRGSSAILALVDNSMVLEYVDLTSDDRWLDTQSRVVFPERIRLEFTRSLFGGTYGRADMTARRTAQAETLLEKVPTDRDKALTRAQLGELWGIVQDAKGIKQTQRTILDLGNDICSRQDGKGATSPRLYWALPKVDDLPSPVEPDDD